MFMPFLALRHGEGQDKNDLYYQVVLLVETLLLADLFKLIFANAAIGANPIFGQVIK